MQWLRFLYVSTHFMFGPYREILSQGGGGWEALVVNAIGHLPQHLRATGADGVIEALWLVNGGHGASLRHHNCRNICAPPEPHPRPMRTES
jgi:hypothetical protein